MKRRLTLTLLTLAIALATALPATAAESAPSEPTTGTFSGQGTPLAQTQAGTSACWSYTVRMRTGDGIWTANHDITWCASSGKITSVSRACGRYSAIYPWQTAGCHKGNLTGINTTPVWVVDAYWRYCSATPVGCAFYGGFRDRVKLNAYGGVSGTWWTW